MAKDSLHSKTILLVDDEPELLHLLETVLRADGFDNVVTASDVAGGLAAYEQRHPDMMPKVPSLSWLISVILELFSTITGVTSV